MDALRRVEAEFLRPHRAGIAAALGLMLVQSLLALPVPLLQGRVVDRLLPLWSAAGFRPPADGAGLAGMIAAVLAITIACHLGRMLLGWKAAAMMSRIGL